MSMSAPVRSRSTDLPGDSAIVAIVITAAVRMVANEEMCVLPSACLLLLIAIDSSAPLIYFLINFDSAALCFAAVGCAFRRFVLSFPLSAVTKNDFI